MGVSESTVNNHVSAAVLQCRMFFQQCGARGADGGTALDGRVENAGFNPCA